MKIAAVLAQATANGWDDDSRHTRSFIAEQVSQARGDLLAAIRLLNDGTIEWHVFHPDRAVRAQQGTAATPAAAIEQVDNAVAAITGTLF